MLVQAFDVELSSQDILGLRNADSVVAFFTGLSYDTSARTSQTSANLGLSELLQKRIKSVELISDQDKLFQVYLFELQSVTVADIKAIGRAFRDKAGNFLFVITKDYECIEFVLLDRIGKPISPTAISTAAPALTLRRFSLDRRHPKPVDRRVLRRFTWTEADPFGQFDKLRFAYDLAYWSEAFFNNRGLFSDYYLRERLPSRDGKSVEFGEWREDPKAAYQRLRAIYDQPATRFAGKKTGELIPLLYEPLLRELGFDIKLAHPAPSANLIRLIDPSSGAPLGTCLPYPWGRELDRKDEMHDSETPEVTPTFAVVEALANEKEPIPWVILTNGKLWRLYSQQAHSRATNYYEVDLDEILGRQGFQQDIQDAFRYFWLLFRMLAFRPVERQWQGKVQSISMLDRLLAGSEEYAKQLGESLKSRVFTQVFPVLAEGFIANMGQQRTTDLGEDNLAAVFRGTLTLLYRLLFLLYAEARDLLPVLSTEYSGASLQRLKKEISDKAGNIGESHSDAADAAQERQSSIEENYSNSEFGLWRRLKAIFAVIDQGSEELNVPRYNGGLFLARRERSDHSPEAEAARFLERERISDRHLALGLDLLARDVDQKSNALVFIDYKSLGVRQLGSIYEGLLEFQLKIANEKLAIVKDKGREVYKSFKELGDRERQRAEVQKAFVRRGRAYLENDKRERKATGSYYTPDHIVKYIVEHAIGPVLDKKLDALRPRLRQAQQERREFFKQQQEFVHRGMKSKAPEQANLIGHELVDELFNMKVLDPAMGSGHFLVEVVDFITDKILEFLNAFPWNPILVHLERMRTDIQAEMDEQNVEVDGNRLTDVNLLKRHVLKRCVYGVDLNPMAVELAKVSLWLDCFTLGAPLSFLDHHFRWGNSLIGSTMAEVNAVREAKKQMTLTGTSEWQGLTRAVQTMIDVGGMPDITPAQVASSKQHYESALSGVEVFKRILDLHTARWFVQVGEPKGKDKKKIDIFDEMLQSGELFEWAHGKLDSPLAHTAMARLGSDAAAQSAVAAKEKRFFHWELEFPEVFYGRRPATETVVERLDKPGFDAVVGNPPYDELSEFYSDTDSAEKTYLSEVPPYSGKKNGRVNLYRLFILRGIQNTAPERLLSYIIPMSLLADDFSKPVREYLLNENDLIKIEAFPQKDDPTRRVFPEAKLSTCIVVMRKGLPVTGISVASHPGATFESHSPRYLTTSAQLHAVFHRHVVIPTISEAEWDILQRVFSRPDWPILGDVADVYVGEIFDNAANIQFLSDSSIGPLVLRGANLDRYLLRKEATQGSPRYLREGLFNSTRKRASKTDLRTFDRIGVQRGSAVDNWRRLIATVIPAGRYCFDTVLLIHARSLPLFSLLGVVNSDLWEWRFRCTSMTNHVNEYELGNLAIPTELTDLKFQQAAALQRYVQSILNVKTEGVRRSEQQSVPIDSADLLIDQLVYDAYGVSEADRKIIRASLDRQGSVRIRGAGTEE